MDVFGFFSFSFYLQICNVDPKDLAIFCLSYIATAAKRPVYCVWIYMYIYMFMQYVFHNPEKAGSQSCCTLTHAFNQVTIGSCTLCWLDPISLNKPPPQHNTPCWRAYFFVFGSAWHREPRLPSHLINWAHYSPFSALTKVLCCSCSIHCTSV